MAFVMPKSTRLRSSSIPRRVHRCGGFCAICWGCSDAFRESLKKLFQTEAPRGEGCSIAPTGELWCKLDNITAHLKAAEGGADEPQFRSFIRR
jgi:hypothetical protein